MMIATLAQLSPSPVSKITGMPNALLSVLILAGVIWLYHGHKHSPVVDGARRLGMFLMACGTLVNLGATIMGKYWYMAVWSEPLWKLGAALLVVASLTERDLWGQVFDAWGRMKPREMVKDEPIPHGPPQRVRH